MLSWLLIITINCYLVISEKVRGTINVADSSGFAFLGKFCFQYLPSSNFSVHGAAAGTVDVELTNKGSHGSSSYYLIMYDDQDNSWSKIYKTGKTCDQKIDGYYRLKEQIKLKSDDTFTKTIGIHQHIRPRWWWLYLANCDAYNDDKKRKNLTTIDYELWFKQNTTSWLKIEVGSNDQGLNIMYSVYLGIYLILFGLQLYSYYVYTIQQYIHQVIKLLTATIGLQLFSVAFHFADWIIFTESGEHEIFFPIIASLCEILSSTIFLLLLLVLAQGWTVSRFEVIYPKLLLGGCITIAIIQCILYIWLLIGLDEQTTTYEYNSVPQYIYGSVFIIIGIIYFIQCIFSYKSEPLESKKNLYILLCIFFSCWFFWPLLRILIGDGFKPWNRDVAIQSISLTLNTLTYFIMMLLMYPTWAHQYFNLSMVDTQERILDSGSIQQQGITKSIINDNKTDYKVLEQDRL